MKQTVYNNVVPRTILAPNKTGSTIVENLYEHHNFLFVTNRLTDSRTVQWG